MPERKFNRKTYQQNKTFKKVVFWLRLAVLGVLLLVFSFIVLLIVFAKDLPRPEKFTEKQSVQSTKIYDRTGSVVLYEIYGEEKRTIVPLSVIPDNLKNAVIATEDANFYHHFGIDPTGILRSIMINLKLGSASYGGSTLDQQLIRSTYFSNEKTFQRKIKEIVLALELDRRYPKDQILEWYLNQIPFGSNAYGVEAASQTYFQKPVSQISLAEAATLVALVRAPSFLSPYGDYKDQLLGRKDYVLERMEKEKYITKEEMEAAKKEEIKFFASQSIKAPHFVVDIVENYLKPKYGEDLSYLKENGLKIYTTLDWSLQEAAEAAVKKGMEINKEYNAYNAALVAMDPKTGEVLAMIGSANWFGEPYPKGCASGRTCLFEPKFNVATGGKNSPGRQPGSAFKPFAYATAFKKGYDDKTKIIDELTNFGVWGDKEYIPQNYDGKFRGEITLRTSLAQSLNIPAVKTLVYLAGIEDTTKTAQALGITTLTPPFGPAIVLGGWEVKLLEITSAYGVFATEGLRASPVSILKVEDNNGNIVEENKKTPSRVLEERPARLINDILSDNEARTPMFGPRSHLYFEGRQVAAKTGTTDDFKDAWTIGYTPSIVIGVWVGNNNNEPLIKRQPAATVAGPIFHELMQKSFVNYPSAGFIKP
ncbi:MAG: PBP1A family penicillin-binding protein [bacterium]|nr:PBP1A family penicillin-binding protein [bacterium]